MTCQMTLLWTHRVLPEHLPAGGQALVWLCRQDHARRRRRAAHCYFVDPPPGLCWLCAQDVIVGERRFQYEADVKRDPLNYDSWFDYIRLEESAGQPDRVRMHFHLPIRSTPAMAFHTWTLDAC